MEYWFAMTMILLVVGVFQNRAIRKQRKTINHLAEIVARLHKENHEMDEQNMIRKGHDPDRNKKTW